jgi:hypothetical protein
MMMRTKTIAGAVVILVLSMVARGAQAQGNAQANTHTSAAADCAELPVLSERLTRADNILHD